MPLRVRKITIELRAEKHKIYEGEPLTVVGKAVYENGERVEYVGLIIDDRKFARVKTSEDGSFKFEFSNLEVGRHSISAYAEDAYGIRGHSNPITIEILPSSMKPVSKVPEAQQKPAVIAQEIAPKITPVIITQAAPPKPRYGVRYEPRQIKPAMQIAERPITIVTKEIKIVKEGEEEKEKEPVIPKVVERTKPVEIDYTKIDTKYTLIEGFAYAHIKWDPKEHMLIYHVIEPKLSDEEKKMLKEISRAIIEVADIDPNLIKDKEKGEKYLEEKIKEVIAELGLNVNEEQLKKFTYYIKRDFLGLERIEPLMRDKYLEDIACDGVGIPIYVCHKLYGSIRTNIVFEDLKSLREFVIKLAQKCGRYISYAEPLLDGTLPDGSRVQATFSEDVTTRGPTFSIRKFREEPMTPVELIELGTGSPSIFAYLWFIVEHKSSILICGGTATGKTTLLNALSLFIPPEDKIITIEDTRELNLPHENWIPSVARAGFGPPTEGGRKYGEVTLFDLLKESLRQNPDYVIVGEIRGKEAYVLFQGMASGHASMGTMHAESLETVVDRLTSPPINLAMSLLGCLDVLIVMVHAKTKGKAARRIKEIIEIGTITPKGPKVNKVFVWSPLTDTFSFRGRSIVLEKLAVSLGMPLSEIEKEIQRRKEVLEWMVRKGIRDFKEVSKIIRMYYKSKKKVLEMIKS